MAINTIKSTTPAASIRRPTQDRGRKKFEAALDAAERLLENMEPADMSIYDIAKALEASPPSVYHFFPEVSLVFVALAERYLTQLQSVSLDVDEPVATWADLLDLLFERIRGILNKRTPVRKVLLGSGYSPEVRQRDLAGYAIFAKDILDALNRHFELPNVPQLADRIEEVLAINDAMWMLSFYRHRAIDDEGARRARNAYLRLYIPEILPRRTP
ncbi:TetR/AcrR family transcriptional regulator [Paraburkholderia sp. BL27I4N3]|uniref:TetR/AcrR family transcriptional regulator n=1 Tax=Paraburkholderia sp. BL27I4N3 TaxID=1938805 RepID=UPI000E278460|nr:TetR/AcrR family transcriptional regulator [Paraburkholderia sp. BL27I4N3]